MSGFSMKGFTADLIDEMVDKSVPYEHHWKDEFEEGARELKIDGKSYIHEMPQNSLIDMELYEEVGTLNKETGKIDYYDDMKPEGFGVQTNDPTSIGKLKSMV